MTTPIHHDILITQGQTWVYLFEHAGLVSDGNGLRLHIRDHHGAALVRCALTHDGAANSRVSFVSGGVLAYLGASISTGWDLQNYKQRRWVYALERYSLSDPDDVTVLRLGDCLVDANPADESSIGTVAPFPSYDLVCLRYDIEQTLSVEQQARARANAGFPEGAIVDWGGIGGDLADQADLAAALAAKSSTSHTHGNASTGAAGFMSAADKTKLDGVATGATANDTDANLRARSSHTGTQLAATISDFSSAASAAAPVQSVAGRTGAVTISVGDVSGAESTANKAQANGYASLDSGGKVPQAQLPSIAITEFLGEAANQAAMLALTGQKGDWCIRTDTGATWIITGTDPTLLGSWTAISYPTGAVTSVAGRTGAVTLSTSDISGLGDAAAKNTGTTAGTVAAGDDSRITGAVQTSRSVATQHSITGGGDLSADRALALVNDSASPGNNKVYGTDGSGVRGWHDAPSGASPGGSGSEMQYRSGATTFGGAIGTHWDVATGRLSIGAGTGTPAGMLHAQASAAAVISAVMQGAASQTANFQEWRNSAGTVLASISAAGLLAAAGVTSSANIARTVAGAARNELGSTSAYLGQGCVNFYSHTVNGNRFAAFASTAAVGWVASGTPGGVDTNPAIDTSVVRAAAAIVGFTNGSTGGASLECKEVTAPSAPAADCVRIYAEDNGSGKTRLMALFNSGAAQQIAIEP